jgi:Nickel responsive protein SCO4226-like
MPGHGRPRGYLVECYWPGVSADKVAAAVERAEQAAGELRSQGRELHFVGSILVPADETVFCLFDGQEADVRAVSEKAGVPFERILEWLLIGGGAHTRQVKAAPDRR